ncbi:MAG: phytoene/squalene synthase family protein [Candidatus Omnitrophica bacterium]|nr:phytoene/squalene synthase family protein [Candidatus Omnitrophota bacterium]
MLSPLNKNKSLKSGFILAKQITKRYAKTFYFASNFLPKEKRNAAYSVYALCRLSDEAVDDNSSALRAEAISRLTNDIASSYANTPLNQELLLAFRHTINKYGIPKIYFDKIIEGMYMDLKKNRYDDFQELYNYCYRVAGVVGLVILKIFGCRNNYAEKYAIELGVAMQLTNILRDIKEDFALGRVYLPQDELKRFGISQEYFFTEKIDERFIEFMRFQIKRARQYYADSTPGIKLVDSVKSRLVILAIKEIYAGILNEIERNAYDIFSKRATVSKLRKIIIIAKIFIGGKFL